VKVIVSDPGDGKAMARYPLEQFLSAWEGSHFTMVATQQPAPAHLPEMVHFDYASGHLGTIADVPYVEFVEQFASHPEAWEDALERFAGEPHYHGDTMYHHASPATSDHAHHEPQPDAWHVAHDEDFHNDAFGFHQDPHEAQHAHLDGFHYDAHDHDAHQYDDSSGYDEHSDLA
jgi:hypothetical protein